MADALLGLLAALVLAAPAHAAPILRPLPAAPSINRPAPPKKRRIESLGIETTSHSVFVADVASGSVLYAKHPHDLMSIASLTKLVTAMVLMDAKINLDDKITFAQEDFDPQGGSYVFAPGDVMTKREAFHALMVGSVNAAGNALARVTMGKEAFVKAMNDKAKELHLASPTFVEPTGVNPLNRANAADVAAMLTKALSYPEIRATASLPSVQIKTQAGKDYLIKSTNLLLPTFLNQKPYHIVGAKTGSLPEAGFCMAQVTSDAAGHEIVVVNLDSANHFARYAEVKAMTAWAFDTYEWR